MWIVILVAAFVAVPTAGAQPPGSGDESAVRAVIDGYVSARDARDARALQALLTADADQYTTSGDWRRGRTGLLDGMAASSRQNPGQRGIDVAAVRFVTPDVAIADGTYAIAGSGARRWTTLVVVRGPDGWRITAIRNMTPTGATPRP